MNTQKVAITVPKDLIAVVDEISKSQGISRSSFISKALRETVKDEKTRKLKEAYNKVFSDESIQKEQLDTCEWFESSGNSEGQKW
jgi:metal-responsive CopG/Arc/MetJ family transcriptional regulator